MSKAEFEAVGMKLIKRERMKGKRTMRDCVVTLRFTDEDGAGVALKPYQAVDCDYTQHLHHRHGGINAYEGADHGYPHRA